MRTKQQSRLEELREEARDEYHLRPEEYEELDERGLSALLSSMDDEADELMFKYEHPWLFPDEDFGPGMFEELGISPI